MMSCSKLDVFDVDSEPSDSVPKETKTNRGKAIVDGVRIMTNAMGHVLDDRAEAHRLAHSACRFRCHTQESEPHVNV